MSRAAIAKVTSSGANLYSSKGVFLRTIGGNNVKSATVEGGVISVQTNDGRIKLYDGDSFAFKRQL